MKASIGYSFAALTASWLATCWFGVTPARAQATQTLSLPTLGLELDVPAIGTYSYRASNDVAGTVLLFDGATQLARLLVQPTGACEPAPAGSVAHPPLVARGYETGARMQDDRGRVYFLGCKLQPSRWRAVMVIGVSSAAAATEALLFDALDALVSALPKARPIGVVRATHDPAAQTLQHPDGWTFDLSGSPNNWAGAINGPSIVVSRIGPSAGLLQAVLKRRVDDAAAAARCMPVAADARPPGRGLVELRPGVLIPRESGGGRVARGRWQPAWIELCVADAQGRVYVLHVSAREEGLTHLDISEISDLIAALAVLAPPPVPSPSAPVADPQPPVADPVPDPAPVADVPTSTSTSTSFDRPPVFRATYLAEYRRVEDPDLLAGLEGAIVATYLGYWGGADVWTSRILASLGFGLGGGVLYDFDWEAGIGVGLGPAHVRLLGGLAYGGVTEGKLAGGIGFPIAIEASGRLGEAFALTARAAARFVPDEDSRGDGSERAPFGDELELFGGVRVLDKGWVLGVSYREQVGTSFAGVAVGIER